MKQVLIAADQLINTLVWHNDEGWGMADETLSARAWRCKGHSKFWRTGRRIIDALFFWQPGHCQAAFESERTRKQLPAGYRSHLLDDKASEHSESQANKPNAG